MFWQRKNARLTARLNTLVETSERVRKTRRRKVPRVIIDNSFVENSQVAATDSARSPYEEAAALGPVDLECEDEASHLAAAADGVEAEIEDESEEAAILHEAIEQLDLAERREAEAREREAKALEQLQEQHDLVKELKEQLTIAKDPLSATDTTEHETNQQLQEHKDLIGQLEEELANERGSRSAAEAERTKALRKASKNQEKLDSLREELQSLQRERAVGTGKTAAEPIDADIATIRAEADARVSVARKEADAQRALMVELQRELSVAEAARTVVETERDAAIKRGPDESQLDELRTALAEAEFAANAAEKSRSKVEARLQEATEKQQRQQARIEELEAASACGEAAQAAVQAAVERAEQAETTLSELKESASRLSEVESRLAAVTGEAETHRARANELEKDAADLRVSLAGLEEQNAFAERRCTEVEEELTTLRRDAAETKLASERAEAAEAAHDEATKELKKLRRQLTKSEQNVEQLREQRAAAEQEKTRAESSGLELRQELEELRKAAAHHESAEQRRAETTAREEELKRLVDNQKDRMADLESELLKARTELVDVKAQREGAAKRATEAQNELTALRDAVSTDDRAAPQSDTSQPEPLVGAGAMDETQVAAKADAPMTDAVVLLSTDNRDQAAVDEIADSRQAKTASTIDQERTSDERELPSTNEEADDQQQVTNQAEDAGHEGSNSLGEPVDETSADEVAQKLAAKLVEKVAAAGSSNLPALRTDDAASSTGRRPRRISSKSETTVQPAQSGLDDRIQDRIGRAVATKEKVKDKRRAKRVASRKIAQLWQDGMSAGLSCTMLDRSSTGAKLEVVTDRFNDKMNNFAVGDRFTLMMTSAQERTSMACEIMWIAGKRCGVRFCGQIYTEVVKQPKKAMPKETPKKATASKAIKSLFGT